MTILFREVAVDEGMCRAEVTLYHPLTEQFDGLSQSEGSRNYQKKNGTMSIASWSSGRQMVPNERFENRQLPTVKTLNFRPALNPLMSRKTEHAPPVERVHRSMMYHKRANYDILITTIKIMNTIKKVFDVTSL